MQNPYSPPWEGVWSGHPSVDFFERRPRGPAWDVADERLANMSGAEARGTREGYAIAFVREPIARLVSAWKDKLACGLPGSWWQQRPPTQPLAEPGLRSSATV